MHISDQEKWTRWVSLNQDPYGSAVICYAQRWAELMEQRIEAGQVLEDVAGTTSGEADIEGITGFMYGSAVSVLTSCWVHGEQLRRWHNLETQIGKEGEAANERGTVLNTALLTIQ